MMKDTFCSYCGNRFSIKQDNYPKKCSNCKMETYSNPLPVSITIIRVDVDNREQTQGILVVKRVIPPESGGWCFPGGYIVAGESWQEGAVREVLEETNIKLDPQYIQLYKLLSTPDNSNLLIFNIYKHILSWKEIKFLHNEEVSEIRLVSSFEELCFPTHTEILKEYLNRYLVLNG